MCDEKRGGFVPIFTPPVAEKRDRAFRSRLGAFFRHDVGLSVLNTAGVFATVQYPSDAQIEAADAVYLGGHVHTITAAESDALTAAGYGAYIS
jgi:hypothetical protein